ncbi:MAG TPA: lysozyme inhibitor LprI family protein, partial [Candidatus Angelobacter sp.]
ALKLCAEVKDVALPATDRPTAEETKVLAGCVSQELYFGFDKTPDPVAARKCAFLEMDRGNNEPFAGKTILMMVYANGKGVVRNLDLALKLGCEVPGGPGDVAGRVHQLARFKQANWSGNNFSVCDHSGDQHMYRECAILDYRFDHLERERTLDAMAAKFTAPQKKMFETLRRETAAYFKVEAAKGINLTGTHEIQENGFLERGFISSLEQLAGGDLPKFSAKEAAEAETAMNSDYDKARAIKRNIASNLTPEGLKETQQAWMRYREAWLKFGKARYPSVSEVSWKAWTAQQREELLQRALY